jgi:hypothetical protein
MNFIYTKLLTGSPLYFFYSPMAHAGVSAAFFRRLAEAIDYFSLFV